jgi:hypothetical protein
MKLVEIPAVTPETKGLYVAVGVAVLALFSKPNRFVGVKLVARVISAFETSTAPHVLFVPVLHDAESILAPIRVADHVACFDGVGNEHRPGRDAGAVGGHQVPELAANDGDAILELSLSPQLPLVWTVLAVGAALTKSISK